MPREQRGHGLRIPREEMALLATRVGARME
jgi:hypothetical protein